MGADPTTELDVNGLLQLKLSLEEKFSTFKQLDGEILELVEDVAIEDEIEQADAYNYGYAATVIIDKHCPPVVRSRTPDRSRTSPVPALEPTGAATRVGLPKLGIRPFTLLCFGIPGIHSSMCEIDKIIRSLVEKSVAEAISGLTLTVDNYQEAVGIHNKLLKKLMENLLAFEPLTSQHKLRELHHLLDVVEAQIRGLKSRVWFVWQLAHFSTTPESCLSSYTWL